MGLTSSQDNSLAVSFIESDSREKVLFRPGDILLTRVSDLEITLCIQPWHHIAIVVVHEGITYAFSKGVFVPIQSYLDHHEGTIIRHLDCMRPSGFDKLIYKHAKAVQKDMNMGPQDLSQIELEGYSAASLLMKLQLVRGNVLDKKIPKPWHFSEHSGFNVLGLVQYSEHMPI